MALSSLSPPIFKVKTTLQKILTKHLSFSKMANLDNMWDDVDIATEFPNLHSIGVFDDEDGQMHLVCSPDAVHHQAFLEHSSRKTASTMKRTRRGKMRQIVKVGQGKIILTVGLFPPPDKVWQMH